MNILDYFNYLYNRFIKCIFCYNENENNILETESERVVNTLYIPTEKQELDEVKSNEENAISYNYDQTEEDINAFLQGIMTNEEKRAYDRLVEVQHTLKPRIDKLPTYQKQKKLRTDIKANKLTNKYIQP